MDLLQMPGHVIRRLNQRSTNLFQRAMKAAGQDLTPVQFAALQAVVQSPGIDQAGIAAAIAYDRATIGGVIERLEQKHFVTRQVSPRDRRAREVRITPLGKDVLAGIEAQVIAFQPEILPGLTEAERQTFLELATKAVRQAENVP